MFFEDTYSAAGRASAGHLESLRGQLGVGVDPAFDYSHAAEVLQKQQAAAKEKISKGKGPNKADLSEQDLLKYLLVQTDHGKDSSTAEQLLREATHVATSVESGPVSPADVRVQREVRRPSSAFLNISRATREKLVGTAQCSPPVGTYQPNMEVGRPRTPTTVGFNARRRTRSRINSYQGTTEIGDVIELRRSHVSCPDLEKAVERPDLIKSAGLKFNESWSTARLEDGDLHCSKRRGQPCFHWSAGPKMTTNQGAHSSEPGKYCGNVDAVRPRSAHRAISFGSQVGRRPTSAPSGTVERMTSADIRDGHVNVVDIAKCTDRPPLTGKFGQAEEGQLLDLSNADEFRKRRPRTADSFRKCLTREQHLQAQRSYADDVCLRQQLENTREGPKSIDLVEGNFKDGPLWERPIITPDFARTPGRETKRRHALMPSRFGAQNRTLKFQRSTRIGDARCKMQTISQTVSVREPC